MFVIKQFLTKEKKEGISIFQNGSIPGERCIYIYETTGYPHRSSIIKRKPQPGIKFLKDKNMVSCSKSKRKKTS